MGQLPNKKEVKLIKEKSDFKELLRMKISLADKLRAFAHQCQNHSKTSINEGLYEIGQAHRSIWPLNSLGDELKDYGQACPALIEKKPFQKKGQRNLPIPANDKNEKLSKDLEANGSEKLLQKSLKDLLAKQKEF